MDKTAYVERTLSLLSQILFDKSKIDSRKTRMSRKKQYHKQIEGPAFKGLYLEALRWDKHRKALAKDITSQLVKFLPDTFGIIRKYFRTVAKVRERNFKFDCCRFAPLQVSRPSGFRDHLKILGRYRFVTYLKSDKIAMKLYTRSLHRRFFPGDKHTDFLETIRFWPKRN